MSPLLRGSWGVAPRGLGRLGVGWSRTGVRFLPCFMLFAGPACIVVAPVGVDFWLAGSGRLVRLVVVAGGGPGCVV